MAQGSTMHTNYQAETLADLADALEARAVETEAHAEAHATQREQRKFKAQADGLRQAARIVRNTTLTGGAK